MAKLLIAFLNPLSPLVHQWPLTLRTLVPLLILIPLAPTPYLVTKINLQIDYHMIFTYVFGIHVVFVINFLPSSPLSSLPTHYSIFAITETWLREFIFYNEIISSGFKTFRKINLQG